MMVRTCDCLFEWYGRAVVIVDQPTGKEIGSLVGHRSTVRLVAFSHQPTIVAYADFDQAVRYREKRGDRWEAVGLVTGHSDKVTAAAFSADGTRLATGSSDKTLRVLALLDGGWREVMAADVSAFPYPCASEFGRALRGVLSFGGELSVFEVDSGAEIAKFLCPGPISGVVLSNHGRSLLVKLGDRDEAKVLEVSCETCLSLKEVMRIAKDRQSEVEDGVEKPDK